MRKGDLASGGVDGAQEVVGDVATIRERNLVCGDVEAAIDLDLTGVDDFRFERH